MQSYTYYILLICDIVAFDVEAKLDIGLIDAHEA